MSGMESMAALGLACNLMQVIQFTFETVSLCKKVFRTGFPDPELSNYLDECVRHYTNIDKSIRSVQQPTADEVELLRVAEQTRDASLSLKIEVERISYAAAKGKIKASIMSGLKAKMRANKLDRLQKQMRGYQKILESGLLDRTCKKVDMLSLRQDQRFNELDAVFKHFLQSYSDGQRHLDGLLDAQTTFVKDLIKSETIKTQQTVTEAVHTVSTKASNDLAVILKQISSEPQIWQKREKLLKSLKYSTMGDRLNQIPPPHDGTYQWIMRGSRLWEEDEGENQDAAISMPTPECVHTNPLLKVCWSCFPCWLESRNTVDKLYWIQGKTGAGKSTLMKFIVTDRGLWSGLDLPDGEPLLLSHFLWAPGGQLQKTIRGLLLALLYQFLSANEKLLDELVNGFPEFKFKDIPGDWTLEELQSLIHRWFPKSDKPIIIFVDGLDEMDPDDYSVPDPLRFITNELAKIEKVKVCVSSRPEQIFVRRFANTPTLRLQDITFFDMKSYAEAYLVPDQGDEYDPGDIQNLVEKLLVKADGVFLWIALVVRSLARGLRNGDSIDELNLRLEQMPRGLNALYQDMWARLNDDEAIYRQEAASYFSMIRDWRILQSGLNDGPREDSDDTIDILGLLLSLQPARAQAILENPSAFTSEQLQTACRDLEKRVERRTAGLLHVMKRHSGRATFVEFIHRSSLEFLENTPEGQKILGYDKTPRGTRFSNLARGFLARIYLRVTGQLNEDIGPFKIHGVLDMISTNYKRGRVLQDDVVDLVGSTHRLLDNAISSGMPRHKLGLPKNFKGSDFVSLLAMLGFDDLVSLFTDGLLLSWDNKLMNSPIYQSSLLLAALTPPEMPMDILPAVAVVGKSRVVAMILQDKPVVDFGPLRREGVISHNVTSNREVEAEAKLMALVALLCCRAFWPSSLPGLSETVDSYTREGIYLDELITVYFEVPPGAQETVFLLSPSCLMSRNYHRPSPTILKGNPWIAIELNVFSLVKLILGAAKANTGLESAREPAFTSTMPELVVLETPVHHAMILAFYVPYWGSMGVDQPRYFRRLVSPGTEEDGNYVLSALGGIALSSEEPNCFEIPDLWKRVEEIVPRAKFVDEEAFRIASHGHLDDAMERLISVT